MLWMTLHGSLQSNAHWQPICVFQCMNKWNKLVGHRVRCQVPWTPLQQWKFLSGFMFQMWDRLSLVSIGLIQALSPCQAQICDWPTVNVVGDNQSSDLKASGCDWSGKWIHPCFCFILWHSWRRTKSEKTLELWVKVGTQKGTQLLSWYGVACLEQWSRGNTLLVQCIMWVWCLGQVPVFCQKYCHFLVSPTNGVLLVRECQVNPELSGNQVWKLWEAWIPDCVDEDWECSEQWPQGQNTTALIFVCPSGLVVCCQCWVFSALSEFHIFNSVKFSVNVTALNWAKFHHCFTSVATKNLGSKVQIGLEIDAFWVQKEKKKTDDLKELKLPRMLILCVVLWGA